MKQKFIQNVLPMAAILSIVALAQLFSSPALKPTKQVKKRESTSQSQLLSYTRYQAGYVCREKGWEFCKS